MAGKAGRKGRRVSKRGIEQHKYGVARAIDYDDLDLLDLLQEKHRNLMKRLERYWEASGKPFITPSEWYILSRIRNGTPSIQEVSRSVTITRQGTHKYLTSLQKKGMLVILSLPHNKRDKYVVLTPVGKEYCEEYAAVKHDLEEEIAEAICKDTLVRLKELLRRKWLS